jgi:ribonuclease BN (tRNA processing enzyme)
MEVAEADDSDRRRLKDLVRGADYAAVDSQYDSTDSVRRRRWGHSSVLEFMELFRGIDLGRLALFHYEPGYSDEKIDEIWREARRVAQADPETFRFTLEATRQGLEVEL